MIHKILDPQSPMHLSNVANPPEGPNPTNQLGEISKNPTHSHVGEDGGKMREEYWSEVEMVVSF